MHAETTRYPSRCATCGAAGKVMREQDVGQLCADCMDAWKAITSILYCSCHGIRGQHSLNCALRMKDMTS